MRQACGQCGEVLPLCFHCHKCQEHCRCGTTDNFDADELGLDPETDNTPKTRSRHA